MPKILILTAAYGEGHNAAARGLQAAFAEADADAEIIDVFALTGGAFYEQSRRAYLGLIEHAPLVWAAAYALVDRLPVVPFAMPLLGRAQRALAEILERRKPDAVLSVYPSYGYLIERIYGKGPLPFAFHTVVTDSITINSVWHCCGSDTFLVPNDDTARVMTRAGVAGEKVRVLGFPVAPRFARDRPPRPAPGIAPRVLFMINAGKTLAPAIVARLLEIPRLHLTVTVGRDEALRSRVEAAAAGRPIEIHGWTERMPELVMTHHLLVGKAGGAAVQEAIAAGTPMLMTGVVPGQEEGNAQLLVENGCGAVCKTPASLAAKIEQLFADGAQEWAAWERKIAGLSRPGAAGEIARFVLAER